MAKNFLCTACGKCCYGQLPLTIADAFLHADRFPLAMIWTPLREGSKDYPMVSRLGTTIKLANRKELAVLIVPSSYIPSSFACPALGQDNLCSIHANKPSRCRTMPFYPYREEQYQAELLTPRPGWECDTSEAAPVVFYEKKIIMREDFDQERQVLLQQAPLIRVYADYILKYMPLIVDSLVQASAKAKAGQVVTSLSSFLTATRNTEAKQIARQQLPILNYFVIKTAGQKDLAEYHKNYVAWAKEMTYLSK
ncbi:YkgJ family cysteine cluster protein [Iodobacter sp. HSC-16F04]|uniref:YkgJ family cysteine cluster protein n=1 Tax=Iodobacter violaceini TaxID=3044271 RepID=A0ABX0L2V4_9NEIS|nr:YkgJ family cysteine cluster protein [Iodobacter violacea]NHQ87721.1 YkgJ family cysteine cluster protein [Iodobacter violacea]